jgi:hypothetical protein
MIIDHKNGYRSSFNFELLTLHNPDWRNSGTKIVFDYGYYSSHPFLIDADDRSIMMLFEGPVNYPGWFPDGNNIAF